jgi:hypothetical protein
MQATAMPANATRTAPDRREEAIVMDNSDSKLLIMRDM